MSRTKVVVATLIATLAVGAVASGSASATEWLVNDTKLVGSAALSTKATVLAAAVLSIPGVKTEVACSGLEGRKQEIIASITAKASSLIFSGCSVLKPETCNLSTASIATEPISAEVKMGSEVEDRVTISPQTKKLLAVLSFAGGSCVLEGEQPVMGKVTVKAPTGQEEFTEQPIEGLGSVENNSLEVAGKKAYIQAGAVKFKLASSAEFSAVTQGWWVRGAALGGGSSGIGAAANVMEIIKLKWGSIEVKCNRLFADSGVIDKTDEAKFERLRLGECTVEGPANCAISSGGMEFGEGYLVTNEVFGIMESNNKFKITRPGSLLAGFSLVNDGGVCGVAGAYNLRGSILSEMHRPREEELEKAFALANSSVEVEEVSTSTRSAATLTGEAKLTMAAGGGWAFK